MRIFTELYYHAKIQLNYRYYPCPSQLNKQIKCAKVVIISENCPFWLKIDSLIFKVYHIRKVIQLAATGPELPTTINYYVQKIKASV